MDLFIESLEAQDFLPAGAILLGGVLLGIILELIVLARLKKFAAHTALQSDDKYIRAAGRFPFAFVIIMALYAASLTLPFRPDIQTNLERVLLIIALGLGTALASRFASIGTSSYLQKTQGDTSASLLTNAVRIFVYILGGLIISESVGIDITALLTALGVGGLAVALALQDTLSNLFSGFYIIAARKIKKGDYVALNSGEEGYIQDITWRNTTIRTLGNFMIIVPNATVANVILTNYNLPVSEMSILVSCGVSYNSDLEQVEKIVKEVGNNVLENTDGAIHDYETGVYFNEFGDSSINFTIVLRAQSFVDQYTIKHTFIKALHERFKQENIEIPFPQQDLHIVTSNLTSGEVK